MSGSIETEGSRYIVNVTRYNAPDSLKVYLELYVEAAGGESATEC